MYQHGQIQYTFPSGMTATASGDKASWMPGYIPHIVRAVGVTFTTSGATTSGAVFAFKTHSMASGTVAADLAVLTVATTGSLGTIVSGQTVYRDGLNTRIVPGTKLVFNVRTAVTGVCAIRAWAWLEPSWETPANATNMQSLTA